MSERHSLVGARVGPWTVTDEVKKKRKLYRLEDGNGNEKLLMGNRVVRLIRETRAKGLRVAMPGPTWRDEV